jgi:hypothetical protein
MAAWREVARMGTSREVAHMAASRDLIRSRHQQVVAGRRQPSGATQSRAQDETRVATIPTNTQVTAGRNLVIELPH